MASLNLTKTEQDFLGESFFYRHSSALWVPLLASVSIASGVGTTRLLNRATRSSMISNLFKSKTKFGTSMNINGNTMNGMKGFDTKLTAKSRLTMRVPYSGGFKEEMDATEASILLGCRETASKDVIRARFKTLMKKNHPDMGGNPYIAAKINEAYSILARNSE